MPRSQVSDHALVPMVVVTLLVTMITLLTVIAMRRIADVSMLTRDRRYNTGHVSIPSYTREEMELLIPIADGTMIHCSDCVTPICVSHGEIWQDPQTRRPCN